MRLRAQDEAVGVYVSVPFCRAKCSFCNFASGTGSAAAMERYLALLEAEIRGARAHAERLGAKLPERVDTVYFGGGTPSLLSPEQFTRIMAALRAELVVDADAEITVEAAPGQIADTLLEVAMREGVNRISLGVQSFVDRECAAVGRLHTGAECVREIARLQAAGVANLGADLIAGLPYQTEETWERSLQSAAGVGLAHLSVYLLEVDEDSRLGREVMAGGRRFHAGSVPSDDFAAALYERACEWLTRHGFAQYEISNFAQEGMQSRHNRRYWERRPYVGFGLDAHSMLRTATGAVRWANADEHAAYLQSQEITNVDARDAFEERVFLGLRLTEGVTLDALGEGTPEEWVEEVHSVMQRLCSEGWMECAGERWRLTARGRLVSNDVFGELLAGASIAVS